MMPFLFFQWNGQTHSVGTNDLLMLLCFSGALAVFFYVFGKQISVAKSLVIYVGTCFLALLGGRIFHLLFERTSLAPWQWADLFSFTGMTFYGSVAGGLIGLVAAGFFVNSKLRLQLWEFAAFAAAIGYGVLRIGCFLNGCCWGRFCEYPWAVMYFDTHGRMPYVGVPVHPVQLYDSALGFSIFGSLFYLKKKLQASELDIVFSFLGMYGFGRLFTELFRGDSYRGVDMTSHLSTSQFISIFLICISLSYFFLPSTSRLRKSSALKAGLFSLLCLFFLSGCLLPEKPPADTWVSTNSLSNGAQLYKYHTKKNRNLLFLASDQVLQKNFASHIEKLYPQAPQPRLEDIVWWKWAPYFESIYDEVVYLNPDQARFNIVRSSLELLEAKGEPFDVIFLTHGFPGFLSDGKPGHFLSWRELEPLYGKLPHMRMVFLQSCYGSDLAPDFIKTGADEVIAFNDLNFNFLFIDLYLGYLRWSPDDPKTAFKWTQGNLAWYMQNKLTYFVILKELGFTPEEYMKNTVIPLYIQGLAP